MTVTRLKRKTQKNRTRATNKIKTIKRLKFQVKTASPFKEESGYILEDRVKEEK